MEQEWKDAALALDEYMHFDEWKAIEEDLYYDWKLVRKVSSISHKWFRTNVHGYAGSQVSESSQRKEGRQGFAWGAGNLHQDKLCGRRIRQVWDSYQRSHDN